MSELEYLDADYEVIRMVNRGPGPGGELPSIRMAKEAALDRRIEKLQKAMPVIIYGSCLLFLLVCVVS